MAAASLGQFSCRLASPFSWEGWYGVPTAERRPGINGHDEQLVSIGGVVPKRPTTTLRGAPAAGLRATRPTAFSNGAEGAQLSDTQLRKPQEIPVDPVVILPDHRWRLSDLPWRGAELHGQAWDHVCAQERVVDLDEYLPRLDLRRGNDIADVSDPAERDAGRGKRLRYLSPGACFGSARDGRFELLDRCHSTRHVPKAGVA